MGRLAKKTTILFEPEEFERLKRAAGLRRCSVGELIRTTLMEKRLLSRAESRLDAVAGLAKLSIPAGTWEELEAETIQGATE